VYVTRTHGGVTGKAGDRLPMSISRHDMATHKQELGLWGEKLVARTFACPRCKSYHSLKRLPNNFKCADVICDFCGYLAQVKTATVRDVSRVPKTILGAAWSPLRKRMAAGIYFPIFIVLRAKRKKAVYYLPVEFQHPRMFRRPKQSADSSRRAGWQGFTYDIGSRPMGAVVRVLP
jgi:hypothetical protein